MSVNHGVSVITTVHVHEDPEDGPRITEKFDHIDSTMGGCSERGESWREHASKPPNVAQRETDISEVSVAYAV